MANPRQPATAPETLEGVTVAVFPYLVDALGVSALGLLVPTQLSLGARFGIHLTLLVLFGLWLTLRLLASTDGLWFGDTRLNRERRTMATGLVVITIVTGVVGLVTLASAAALRFQPSTQFLELLSALYIAWGVATVMVAAYWLWGRRQAIVGGAIVAVLCLGSIARYLNAIGFTAKGKWRLDASALWTYVLPFDIAVAAVAIGLYVSASKRRARRES